MKISALSFGIAGAITTSTYYTLAALFIKTWPYETLKFFSSSYMIPRLENIAPYIKITNVDILTGLSVHFIAAFLFFWLLGCIYNFFTPSRQ